MIIVDYVPSKLARERFDCGNSEMNHYLRKCAGQDLRRNLTKFYAILNDNADIIGFYTLTNCHVSEQDLPEDVVSEMRNPYGKFPATLIGRLAVDINHTRKKYGTNLLVDAYRRIVSAPAASALVVVDAIDETAEIFYLSNGWRKMNDVGKRLFITTKKIATSGSAVISESV